MSRDIGADVKKLQEVLGMMERDPRYFDVLRETPEKIFKEYGLDLAGYVENREEEVMLTRELAVAITQGIDAELKRKTLALIDAVAATDYRQSTETSYEYNFDNSTKTDYKYESHTGTQRGTFSETKTGEATNTESSFHGLTPRVMQEILKGPLLREEALDRIMHNVQNSLAAAMHRGPIRR
jgi:hypothetical protein